jgi:4'-phosphopantetheinyl transferase
MHCFSFTEIRTGAGFVHVYNHKLVLGRRDRKLLSDVELQRAEAYGDAGARKRYMAAHVFLRNVLCRYTHSGPEDIKFGFSPYYNKPFWANGGLHFNLSYRDKWVLLAVSDKPVGADLERRICINQMADFARDYFSEKEIGWLEKSENEEEKNTKFFRLWTLKEAYIKAIGKGLSYPLQDFSVLMDGPEPMLELPDGMERKWGFKVLKAQELYAAAVCYRTE